MRASIRTSMLVVFSAALLGLSACGSDDKKDSSSTTPAASTSTPATTPSAPTSTPATTPTEGDAVERYRQTLERTFTPEQAKCIVDGVVDKLGKDRFERLYGKGKTPAEVRMAIIKVTHKCAPKGPGVE